VLQSDITFLRFTANKLGDVAVSSLYTVLNDQVFFNFPNC